MVEGQSDDVAKAQFPRMNGSALPVAQTERHLDAFALAAVGKPVSAGRLQSSVVRSPFVVWFSLSKIFELTGLQLLDAKLSREGLSLQASGRKVP